MSFDDQIQDAVDRTLMAMCGHLEGDLRAFVQDLTRLASAERSRAVAQVAEAAAADLDELRSAANRRIGELTGEISSTEEMLATQRADLDAQAGRLADAVRALDEAPALGDVLDTLADSAGREADRAVVLLVKGDRLNGWRLSGFGASAAPARTVDLSLAEAGLAGMVVRIGVAAAYPGADPDPEGHQPPPFARDARARDALALPVIVGGAVVAVLYADVLRTASSSSRWSAALEVLVRHAGRVLEAMTVQEIVRSLTEGDRSLLGSVR